MDISEHANSRILHSARITAQVQTAATVARERLNPFRAKNHLDIADLLRSCISLILLNIRSSVFERSV